MQRSTLKDLDPIMTADLMAGSCASIFTDQDDRVSRRDPGEIQDRWCTCGAEISGGVAACSKVCSSRVLRV